MSADRGVQLAFESFGRGTEDFRQAEWLSEEMAGQWRYDHTAGRWHHWNGRRWQPDQTDQVKFETAALARAAIARGTWSDGGRPLGESGIKTMLALLKLPAIERALEALSTFDGYGTNGDDWDSDPYLLGCENGIVDLRTNTLMPSPPSTMLVTKTTGCKFKPVSGPDEFSARAPRFMSFLEEIMSGDASMVSFLILWFGASIFGFSPEQRFLLLTGIGRNGKGALKHSVMKAVGEYGEQFDANLYMRSQFGPARSDQARADLLKLKGMRIAFFSEPQGNRFNEEMLKAHTGGDRITARALYSNNIQSWDPTHSITFLVNNAPEVEDLGPSMAARVMVADFRERYDGEREDKRLYGKLEHEKDGILAILCWAAWAWYTSWANGGQGITLPKRVVEQSQRFMERGDPVAAALDEVFRVGVEETCPGQVAYDAYREWFLQSGQDGECQSMVKFAAAMERKGFRKEKTRAGMRWKGFSVRGAIDLAMRDGDESDEE